MRDESLLTGCAVRAFQTLLLAVGLSLVLGLHGCAGSREPSTTPLDGPPGFTATAERGVRVLFPSWLDIHPDLRAKAVKEIDAANYPDGWTVRISLPVWWNAEHQRLVVGVTYPSARYTVLGWRRNQTDAVLLPAAAYEASNARLGRESNPEVLTQENSK